MAHQLVDDDAAIVFPASKDGEFDLRLPRPEDDDDLPFHCVVASAVFLWVTAHPEQLVVMLDWFYKHVEEAV